jgi:hypothetical protein
VVIGGVVIGGVVIGGVVIGLPAESLAKAGEWWSVFASRPIRFQ